MSVVAQGADSAGREIRDVGESAIQSSTGVGRLDSALGALSRAAGSVLAPLQVLQGRTGEVADEMSAADRSAGGASRSLSGFAAAALAVVGPVSILNSRLNETDEDLDSVRNSAIGASGAMNAYAGSSLAATAASYTVHDALIAGAIPSLIVLLSTLGPLVGVLGAVTAGALALAGGFGLVLASGAVAWFGNGLVPALQRARDETVALVAAWGQQFIPTLRMGINAIPDLVARSLEAAGAMGVFEQELRRLGTAAMTVIPQMIAWFMDLGREIMPVWRDFTAWVGQRVPDALVFFRSVVERTYPAIHSLTLSLLDALATFTEFGVVATNVVGPMLETVLGGFERLLNWVMDLPPPLRDLTVALAALAPVFTVGAVAAAEVLRIFGALGATFTATSGVLGGLVPSFGSLATVLGGVGAAVIAFAAAYRSNFAGIRQATNRVVTAFRNQFVPTFQLARSVIGPILADLGTMFGGLAVSVEQVVGRIVTAVSSVLVAGINAAGPIVRGALRSLDSAWQTHRQTVMTAVQSVGTAVSTAVTLIATRLRTLAPAVMAAGRAFLSNLVPAIRGAIQTGRELANQYITLDNWARQVAISAGILAAGFISTTGAAAALFNPLTALYGAAQTLALAFGVGGLSGILGRLAARFPRLAAVIRPVVGVLGTISTAVTRLGTRFLSLGGILGQAGTYIRMVAVAFGNAGLAGALTVLAGIMGRISTRFAALGGVLTQTGTYARMVAIAFGNAGLSGALTVLLGIFPRVRAAISRVAGTLAGRLMAGLRTLPALIARAAGGFARFRGALGSVRMVAGLAAASIGRAGLVGSITILLGMLPSLRGLLAAIPGVLTRVAGGAVALIGRLGAAGLAGSFRMLVGLIPTLVAAFIRIGPAILGLTGPIGWAIAIAAVLYGAWQTNFLGIRDLVYRVLAGIKTTLRGDMSAIRTTVQTVLNWLSGFWTNTLVPLGQRTREVFNTIRTVISNALSWIWTQVVQPTLNDIVSLYRTHGDELVQETYETYEAIKGYIQGAVDFIWPLIQGFIDTSQSAWDRWGGEILAIVEFAFDMIRGVVQSAIDILITTILVAMNIIQGDWGEAWSEIVDLGRRLLDGFVSFVSEWGGRLLDYIGGLLGDVKDWFIDGFNDAVQAGKDALDGLLDWIRGWDIVGTLRSVFSAAGGAAAEGLKSAFNAVMPSSVGIDPVSIAGEQVFGGASISLPSLDTGGYIEQDGVAMLHAGERVLPESQVDREGAPIPSASGGESSSREIERAVYDGMSRALADSDGGRIELAVDEGGLGRFIDGRVNSQSGRTKRRHARGGRGNSV